MQPFKNRSSEMILLVGLDQFTPCLKKSVYISVTALDINSPEHVEFDLSSGRFYCELHSAAEEEEGDEGHRDSQV